MQDISILNHTSDPTLWPLFMGPNNRYSACLQLMTLCIWDELISRASSVTRRPLHVPTSSLAEHRLNTHYFIVTLSKERLQKVIKMVDSFIQETPYVSSSSSQLICSFRGVMRYFCRKCNIRCIHISMLSGNIVECD